MAFIPPFARRLQHPTGHFPSSASAESQELFSLGVVTVRSVEDFSHLRRVLMALDINPPYTEDDAALLLQALKDSGDPRIVFPPVAPAAKSKTKPPRNITEAMGLRKPDAWEQGLDPVEAPAPVVADPVDAEESVVAESAEEPSESETTEPKVVDIVKKKSKKSSERKLTVRDTSDI